MISHNMQSNWFRSQYNPMFFTAWTRESLSEPTLTAGSGILIRKNNPDAEMIKYTGTLPVGESTYFERAIWGASPSKKDTPTLIAGVIGGWRAHREECHIFIHQPDGETLLVHWDHLGGGRRWLPYWELVG
jgi:hypothetical protein